MMTMTLTRAEEDLSRSTETDKALFSIRIAGSPDTLCTACGKQETGTGPVGYLDGEPICDLCLLKRTTDLGLILALVSVIRAYASMGAGTSEAHQEALAELGAFARIFHRIASKSWPARVLKGLPVGEQKSPHVARGRASEAHRP